MNEQPIETSSITFTETKYKKFKKAYKEADKEGKLSFIFEDKEVLVTYARYIIQYLSNSYE
jgi:hypothetical protein